MATHDKSWDENTYDITLTEGELRTIAVALNSYAHAMSDQFSRVLQDGVCDHMGYVRDVTADEIKDARRAIDRAFGLQEKLRGLYAPDAPIPDNDKADQA